MAHQSKLWFILLALFVGPGAQTASAQTLQPVLRASIHDQNGDGKGDVIAETTWQGLLRRGANRENRAIAEFDLSAFQGHRLGNALLAFELAVNNAGGASVREFEVMVYEGMGKAEPGVFSVEGKLISKISFSIQANPASYQLDATRQVQAAMDAGAKQVGIRFNPVGDANFPSILTEISLTVKTKAAAEAEARIAGLIRRLGDAQFKVREAASAELLKVGEPARPQLEKAMREGADAEIRERAKSVLARLDQEKKR